MAGFEQPKGLKWRRHGNFVFGRHKITGDVIAKITTYQHTADVVLFLNMHPEIESGTISMTCKGKFASIKSAKLSADEHASQYVFVPALVSA